MKKILYKGIGNVFNTSEAVVKFGPDNTADVDDKIVEFLLANFPRWFSIVEEGQKVPLLSKAVGVEEIKDHSVVVPTIEEVRKAGHNERAAVQIVARQAAFAKGLNVAQADEAGRKAAEEYDREHAPVPAEPVKEEPVKEAPSADANAVPEETEEQVEARLKKEAEEAELERLTRPEPAPEPVKPTATSALKPRGR